MPISVGMLVGVVNFYLKKKMNVNCKNVLVKLLLLFLVFILNSMIQKELFQVNFFIGRKVF